MPADNALGDKTKEIAKRWGADAVRDCDGTALPENPKQFGKVYNTYFIVRGDNEWGRLHPEEAQRIFLLSERTLATANTVEIEIMKYVGATDWYIRWPFVIEGTIMGILGAVIAFVPVCMIYSSIVDWWADRWPLFSLVAADELSTVVIVDFLVIGCLLGAFGSVLSIRKHLKV